MPTWNQGCSWKKKLTHMRGTTAILTQLKAAIVALNDNGVKTDPSLAVHACTSYVNVASTVYQITGSEYKLIETKATLSGLGTIPANKYGAFAFDVDATGTVTAYSATANPTGYTTAPLAIAGLPAVASTSVRLGTLAEFGGFSTAFVPGTTVLSAGSAIASFTDSTTLWDAIAASITESVPSTDN